MLHVAEKRKRICTINLFDVTLYFLFPFSLFLGRHFCCHPLKSYTEGTENRFGSIESNVKFLRRNCNLLCPLVQPPQNATETAFFSCFPFVGRVGDPNFKKFAVHFVVHN